MGRLAQDSELLTILCRRWGEKKPVSIHSIHERIWLFGPHRLQAFPSRLQHFRLWIPSPALCPDGRL